MFSAKPSSSPVPDYVQFHRSADTIGASIQLSRRTISSSSSRSNRRKETYPPGRFLDADISKEGKVILDFNKAYNHRARSRLNATVAAPKQNRLAIPLKQAKKRRSSLIDLLSERDVRER